MLTSVHEFTSGKCAYPTTEVALHPFWPGDCCCCCWVASVVSDSVRPHRQQPTRLRRPWDSPGKNTGMGCHFLYQCMKVKSQSEVAQSCLTLSDPMQPTRLLHLWDFPGKTTGVGCHCLTESSLKPGESKGLSTSQLHGGQDHTWYYLPHGHLLS